MGQIIQLHCTQCGFDKELFVGGGLLDCELKTMIDVLPQDGRRMLSAAAEHGANQFSITRRLCVCDSCGAIYALPVVSYNMKGLYQELYGLCPQCGAAGNGKWKESETLACPDCGNELTRQEKGHWD